MVMEEYNEDEEMIAKLLQEQEDEERA